MKISSPESGGERSNSSPTTTGRDGYGNACQLFKEDRNGSSRGEMRRLVN